MRKWWWWWIPGEFHARWTLEKTRLEAHSAITGNRLRVQLMARRPRDEQDKLDLELLAEVLKRFDEIEAGAKVATLTDELRDLISVGELQEIESAYFCPIAEIQDEGSRAIDNLEIWGIPKVSVKRLRDLFNKRLEKSASAPRDARGALHSIFAEVDEWGDYIDEYEGTMKSYTQALFWSMLGLLIAAGLSLHYAPYIPPLLWLGLFTAGGAGSCVSVLAKMPALDVSLAGELDAYGRRIWSRIGVGAIGSLIGSALLAWGVFPIAIQNQTFTDALLACTAYPVPTGAAIKTLIVIGTAMLLGVSERTLTSFEQRVFGNSKAPKE